MSDEPRCGAFPDPYTVPMELAPSVLPTCGREPGHPPPHRARWTQRRPMTAQERELFAVDGLGFIGDRLIADETLPPVEYEWRDPEPFERAMRELQDKYGQEALRMWVERQPMVGEQRDRYTRQLDEALADVRKRFPGLRLTSGLPPDWLESAARTSSLLSQPPNWGPAPEPVAVGPLDEFERAYGPRPGMKPGLEPSFTVDRMGGTYSMRWEPIPAGWRGWLVRARLRAHRVRELMDDMAAETNRLMWWPLDTWDRWRRHRRT